MRHPASRPKASLAALILLAYLASLLLPATVFAQSAANSNVERGQEYYEQSRFDEAISLLKDLVDRGALQGDDLQHARELLARSYVKKGYPVQGKEMFKAILKVNPEWRPDPIRVPPDETAVFEQALKEYTAESSSETPPAPGETTPPATTTPPETTTPPPPPPPAPKPSPTPAAEINPNAGQTEGKKSNKMLWYVLGGVVVVGGIAAAAAGGGGSGGGGTPPPQVLAGFPGPPTP